MPLPPYVSAPFGSQPPHPTPVPNPRSMVSYLRPPICKISELSCSHPWLPLLSLVHTLPWPDIWIFCCVRRGAAPVMVPLTWDQDRVVDMNRYPCFLSSFSDLCAYDLRQKNSCFFLFRGFLPLILWTASLLALDFTSPGACGEDCESVPCASMDNNLLDQVIIVHTIIFRS